MIHSNQSFGRPKEDDQSTLHKGNYEPPRVFLETRLALETNLLGASIWQTMNIEIAGQGMQGLYFEEGDIVTDNNYWGD